MALDLPEISGSSLFPVLKFYLKAKEVCKKKGKFTAGSRKFPY